MATCKSISNLILNLLTLGQKDLAQASTRSPWKNTSNVSFLLLSIFIATLTPLLPPRSFLRRGLFTLHLFLLCQAFLARAPPQVTNPAILYTSGVLLGVVTARAFDRLWSCIPEERFHRLIKIKSNHAKEKGDHNVEFDFINEDACTLNPFQRWLWALELTTVTRGIGWDWRVSGIPNHNIDLGSPHRSRRFVVFSLLRLCTMYGSLYLVSWFSRVILNGFENVGDAQLRERLVWVTEHTVIVYVLIAIGWGVTIYSHFGMLMLPLGVLCVGLRVGPRAWQEVEAWPPNFGNWREAYSIRRWWGIFWHQQLRRVASTPGALLLSHLFPLGYTFSFSPLLLRLFKRYAHLLLTFLISGLIHSCGTLNITRSLALGQHVPFSPVAGTGIDVSFYLLQGLGIMLEDFSCWTLGINDQSAQPPTQLRRWLGYAVTTTFHVYSRVEWKAVPLARAHGFVDGRGELYAALRAMEVGASAVPGNFVRWGIEVWVGK